MGASIERDRQRPGNWRVGEECIRRIEERIERSTVGEEVRLFITGYLSTVREAREPEDGSLDGLSIGR